MTLVERNATFFKAIHSVLWRRYTAHMLLKKPAKKQHTDNIILDNKTKWSATYMSLELMKMSLNVSMLASSLSCGSGGRDMEAEVMKKDDNSSLSTGGTSTAGAVSSSTTVVVAICSLSALTPNAKDTYNKQALKFHQLCRE